MSNLNPKAAWGMSKSGVLLYLFCLLQVPYRFLLIINLKLPFKRLLMILDAIFLIFIGLIALEQFVSQFVNWL
jgi:hypothetical protein